ncbi:cobalamin-binding protein [Jeotgalibacillus campisalis]|uniref:Vitamin B12-binding protein n=1 Tax=Jeotgalibacillus campisalis TaxID=220754 RepID=A0A0C2RPJ7_9BACL|nr:cobalamin-binding protein [Jeotgalibacillus campisalis]KIL43669.1 vitamin B12-binding protein precursor [Jeotgalibacillus campisalis]
MRIASLCPSNTELLHYLGLTSSLVGVDDFSDWPKSITHLPRLGPDLSINIDQLEALEPDLIVASLSVPGMEKNIEELQKRNLPHIVLNPQSLAEIGQDLMTLGKAAHCEDTAAQVHSQYVDILEEFTTASRLVNDNPSLYWEWWPKPVFTPGSVNWLTEVSLLAGGTNLFSDIELASIQTDWQDVFDRNPDHICLAWVGVRKEKIKPELIFKRPRWSELTAVKENRIHILEEDLYCRPSPRLIEGIWKLGSLLHPQHYKTIQLPEIFTS